TGGARRMWSHGLANVRKGYTLSAAAHNLGLILRKLLGWGKPREFAAQVGALLRALIRFVLLLNRARAFQVAMLRSWRSFVTNAGVHNRFIPAATCSHGRMENYAQFNGLLGLRRGKNDR